jgi:hypothetical protein
MEGDSPTCADHGESTGGAIDWRSYLVYLQAVTGLSACLPPEQCPYHRRNQEKSFPATLGQRKLAIQTSFARSFHF